MALGDITILNQEVLAGNGAKKYNVAASATLINAGEPAAYNALADSVVIPADNNSPTVGSDFYVGIAATTSTNTSSLAGEVWVTQMMRGVTYLIKPKVAATYDTQAEYDALVGDRVLIDLTASSYTLLATDGATFGCVIEPLDVAKYPGRVAFSFRDGASYLGQ